MNTFAFILILAVSCFALAFLILFQLGYFQLIFPSFPTSAEGWIGFIQGLVIENSAGNSIVGTNMLGIIAFVGSILVMIWLIQEAIRGNPEKEVKE